MHTLDERQVDRAWQRTSRLPPAEARQTMHDLAKTYPAPLAFVLATTEELGKAAQSLANALYFQIARTFTQTLDGKLPSVSEEQLAQLFERNLEALGADGEEEEEDEEDPWTSGSGQPHLLRRLLEALFDAPAQLDGAEISEEEVGHLFLVLKTVVDALDGDANHL